MKEMPKTAVYIGPGDRYGQTVDVIEKNCTLWVVKFQGTDMYKALPNHDLYFGSPDIYAKLGL